MRCPFGLRIHPFEGGSGRIGRAIADMALAQDMPSPTQLYSLSRQLLESRATYCDALNKAQCGRCYQAEWVQWLVASQRSGSALDKAIERSGRSSGVAAPK